MFNNILYEYLNHCQLKGTRKTLIITWGWASRSGNRLITYSKLRTRGECGLENMKNRASGKYNTRNHLHTSTNQVTFKNKFVKVIKNIKLNLEMVINTNEQDTNLLFIILKHTCSHIKNSIKYVYQNFQLYRDYGKVSTPFICYIFQNVHILYNCFSILGIKYKKDSHM